jgi:hypothetical protein
MDVSFQVSPAHCSRSQMHSEGPQDAGVAARRGRGLRSSQGHLGSCGTTGAPRPERCVLPSNRRLQHTRRRRASTAQQGELAFYSKKLSGAGTRYSTFDRELLAAFSAVRHFRFLLEGRQFRLLTDHKPLVTSLFRTTPPCGPPTATALLHRRIHIRHQTHTRPRERGGRHLEPPTSSSRAATAANPADLSRPHRRGLARGRPGGTGAAHFGCHRRCAAGRFFCNGRCAAILPRGGGDDELHHTADHKTGGRRRHAARGRFNRSVPPACAHPT